MYLPINFTFAPETKLSAKNVRKAVNEYGLFSRKTTWDTASTSKEVPFLDRSPTVAAVDATPSASSDSLHAQIQALLAPTEDVMQISVPTLSIHALRAITKLHCSDQSLSFDEADVSTETIELMINAVRSKATTPEEQALGHFTRRKLKKLSTWAEWKAGESKQLDQMHALEMYGEPIDRPLDRNAIILRPHWQYHIKRCGTRRARQCCNGSKQAAPILHALAMTYSSCVEHPIQRLFFAISAQLNLKIYGGDAKDAFAHSPGPAVPTYMSIDDAFSKWYEDKFGKKLDRSMVLPV